jgi:ribosomal protein S18 acetylase RimI-like enzyme
MVTVSGPGLVHISLRPADDGDDAFLFEVYASSRREPLDPLGWDRPTADAFLRTQFEAEERDWRHHQPGAQCCVVLRDGVPAGRLYLARGEHELRVMDITLLPAHQRQGIGTALLQELLDEATRTRRTVRAHVERTSPAVRLYRRLGFLHAATRGATWLMEWTPRAAA